MNEVLIFSVAFVFVLIFVRIIQIIGFRSGIVFSGQEFNRNELIRKYDQQVIRLPENPYFDFLAEYSAIEMIIYVWINWQSMLDEKVIHYSSIRNT